MAGVSGKVTNFVIHNLKKEFKDTPKFTNNILKSFSDTYDKTTKSGCQLIKKQINNEDIPHNDHEIPHNSHDSSFFDGMDFNKILKDSFDMVNAHELIEDFKKVQSGETTPLSFLSSVLLGHAGSKLGSAIGKRLLGPVPDFKNDGVHTFKMFEKKYGKEIPDKVETLWSNFTGWVGSKFGIEPEQRLSKSDNHNLSLLLQNISLNEVK